MTNSSKAAFPCKGCTKAWERQVQEVKQVRDDANALTAKQDIA